VTSAIKIAVSIGDIVHIDRSDAFTRQPCSLKTAARLAVLIWIKSCARCLPPSSKMAGTVSR
jgi:hypothetical protein